MFKGVKNPKVLSFSKYCPFTPPSIYFQVSIKIPSRSIKIQCIPNILPYYTLLPLICYTHIYVYHVFVI